MANILILHGTDASPASNWFMWLKGILVGQGHNVWLPQLPNASSPNAEEYTKFLLSNDEFALNSQTLIIGHSSGAVEALYLLQHIKTTVKAVICVSAFKDDLGREALTGLFEHPLDFEMIRSHCERFVFIHSDDDPYVPIDQAEYLAIKTGGELVTFEGQGHFNIELSPSYKRFPELLEILDDVFQSSKANQ